MGANCGDSVTEAGANGWQQVMLYLQAISNIAVKLFIHGDQTHKLILLLV